MTKVYGIKAINFETGEVRWLDYQWSDRLQAYIFSLTASTRAALQDECDKHNNADDLGSWRFYIDTIPRYMSDGQRTTISL